MPGKYFKKKGQRNKFKMTNPLKQMMDPAMTVDPMLGGAVAEDSAYLYKSPNNGDTDTKPTAAGADETEGQDEDKIFDDQGNQIGYWDGDTKYNMDGTPMEEGPAMYKKKKY